MKSNADTIVRTTLHASYESLHTTSITSNITSDSSAMNASNSNNHFREPVMQRQDSRSSKELMSLSAWLRKARKFRQSSRSLVSNATDSTDTSTVCSLAESTVIEEKRVRFSSRATMKRTLTRRSMTPKERSNVWYSKEELDVIRRTSRCTAFNTVMFSPHFVPSINQTLKNAEYMALTMDDTGVDKLLHDEVVIDRQIKGMREWCSKSDEAFRGLENWVSEQHRHVRSEHARDSRRMVLESSRLQSSSQEAIAMQYKEMATVTTILARFFAEADAIAAGESAGLVEV